MKKDNVKERKPAFPTTPGERLGWYIEKAGMSQREFAAKANVTQAAVSNYMRWGQPGARTPASKTAMKMAEVLGISYEDFFAPEDMLISKKNHSIKIILDTINEHKNEYTTDDKAKIIEALF